jgi:large repetitive protein
MSQPIPNTTINLPSQIFVNEPFSFDVQFNNTSTTNGFIPAFDLIIPSIITLSSPPAALELLATSNGASWISPSMTVITGYPGYPASPPGPWLLPPVGPVGSKLYLYTIPYSSYNYLQPILTFTFNAIVAAPNQSIPLVLTSQAITTRGIFLLGKTATENAITSPPQFESPVTQALFMPIQYTFQKTHVSITANKNATGPNYPIPYQIKVHIAPGQYFTDLILTDLLDSRLRHDTNIPITFSSSPVLSPPLNPYTSLANFPAPGFYTIPDNLPSSTNPQEYIFNVGFIQGAPTTGTDYIINFSVYVNYYSFGTSNYALPVSSCGCISDIIIPNASSLYNGPTGTNSGILCTISGSTGATGCTGSAPGICPASSTKLDYSCDEFPAAPIVISKGINGPSGPAYYNEKIQYTITVYISDYYAFSNGTTGASGCTGPTGSTGFNSFYIDDVISAGQIYIPPGDETNSSFVPTYTLPGGSTTPFTLANAAPVAILPGSAVIPFDYTTEVKFYIPDGLYKGAFYQTVNTPNGPNNPMTPYNGPISNPPISTAVDIPGYPGSEVPPQGPTIITITYWTILQNEYIPTPPTPVPEFNKLELLDPIDDAVTLYAHNNDPILGYNISGTPYEPCPNPHNESSGANYVLPSFELQKTVYAHNGVLVNPNDPLYVNPNDTVTYRSTMTLPLQNITSFIWTDYLPPPIVQITGGTFTTGQIVGAPTATPPAAWQISYGPNYGSSFYPTYATPTGTQFPAPLNTDLDTFLSQPTLVVSPIQPGGNNFISLDFGAIQDKQQNPANNPPNVALTIDLLYTVVVTTAAFKDGILFSNQAVVSMNNNISKMQMPFQPQYITLNEPNVYIKKGVVTTGDTGAIFTDISNVYGGIGATGLGPNAPTNITPLTITDYNSFVGGNITGITDPTPTIRNVLLVANIGNAPAYNVSVQDIISPYTSFVDPPFIVAKSDGTILTNGVDYTHSGIGQTLTVNINVPIPGNDLFIIVYEMQLQSERPTCLGITNTAAITAFYNGTSEENYVDAFPDTRIATITNYVENPSIDFNSLNPVVITPVINGVIADQHHVTYGQTASFNLVIYYPIGVSIDSKFTLVSNIPVILTANNSVPSSGSITATNYAPSLPNPDTTTLVWDNGSVTSSAEGQYITYPFTVLFPNTLNSSVTQIILTGTVVNQTIGEDEETNTCTIVTSYPFNIQQPTVTAVKNYSVDGNQIVYSVLITNTGALDAYNVHITDALPTPFIDNWVLPPTSSPIAFDIDNSTATNIDVNYNIIPISGSTTLTFNGILDPTTTSGTSFSNTAHYCYESAPVMGGTGCTGASGPSGSTGSTGCIDIGSKQYCADTSTVVFVEEPAICATVQNITYLNHNADAGTPNRGQVGAIGDVMRYTITLTVPPGLNKFNDIIMQYPLSTDLYGLELISGSSIVAIPSAPCPSGSPLNCLPVLPDLPITINYASRQVIIDFLSTTFINPSTAPESTQTYTLILDFRISNVASNIAGYCFQPTITLYYGSSDEEGQPITNSITNSDVTPCVTDFCIVEPNLIINKTLLSNCPESLQYQIVITNNNSESDPYISSAFGIELIDSSLNDPNLFSSVVIAFVGGTGPSNWTLIQNPPLPYLEVGAYGEQLLPGASITFIVTATYQLNQPNPFQLINNNSIVTYKSMSADVLGGGTYPRTGSDGPVGLNNYYADSSITTLIGKPLIKKYSLGKAESPCPGTPCLATPKATIGDTVVYALIISLPPGSYSSISVTDTFNSIMSYITDSEVVYTTQDPCGLLTATFDGSIGGPSVIISENSITITVSNITVNPTATPNNNSIAIYYNMSVGAFASNLDNTVISNTVTLNTSCGTASSSSCLELVNPQLYITKEINCDQENWSASDTVPYTIVVGHLFSSGTDAYNLTITDTAASGNQIQNANITFNPPYSPLTSIVISPSNVMTVTVSQLPIGYIMIINYDVVISESACGTQTNNATLLWHNVNQNNEELEFQYPIESACNSIYIGNPIPSVNKTPSITNATTGDVITWTINYCNNGSSTGTCVQLIEGPFPSWITVQEEESGWIENSSGKYINNLPNLGPHSNATVTFTYQITGIIPVGTELLCNKIDLLMNSNCGSTGATGCGCSGSSGSTGPCCSTLKATDTQCISLTPPPFPAVEKTADKTNVMIGDVVTWTIHASNTGGSTGYNPVLIEGPLPSWVQFIGPTGSTGSICSIGSTGASGSNGWINNSGIYTYYLPCMAAGTSIDVPFSYVIVGDAGATGSTRLCNTVTFALQPINSPVISVSDTECINVLIDPELYIDKQVNCDCNKQWTAGDTVPYIITVGHCPESESTAYNISINDSAVGNISNVVVTFSPPCAEIPYNVAIEGNDLSVNVDNLPLGYTIKVKYDVLIDTYACGLQQNNAGLAWTITPFSETQLQKSASTSITIGDPIPVVTKVADKMSVVIGDIVTWTITASNTGSSVGYNPVLTEGPLSSSVVFVGPTGSTGPICTMSQTSASGSSGWLNNSGIYTYNLPCLLPGTSISVPFQYQIIDDIESTLCNTVNLTMFGCTGSTGATGFSASYTTCIESSIDPVLYIDKKVGCECDCLKQWSAGDTVPYTIIVGHCPSSKSTAYNVQLTDVPSGVILPDPVVTINPPCTDIEISVSIIENQLTITTPNLPLEYTIEVHYCVQLNINACGDQTNDAIVRWTRAPDSESSLTAEASTTINISDPIANVNKIADKISATVGDTITWTITASNNGNSTGHNVQLIDGPIPSWAQFLGPTGWMPSGLNTYTYNLQDIKPHSSVQVPFIYSITDSIPDGTTGICNTVNLSMTSGCTGSSGSTASDTECINIINDPVLYIDKKAGCECDCLKQWSAGEIVPYEIIVGHCPSSESTAYNLQITDLSPGIILPDPIVTINPPCVDIPISVNINGNQLTINIPNLPLEYSIKVHYCVRLDINACGDQTNNATIRWTRVPDTEFSLIANTSTTINISGPIANVNKIADKMTATIGDTITWTITASNNGNSTGHNVQLIDGPIPSWVQFLGPTGPNGWTLFGPGIYAYNLPDLFPHSSTEIPFKYLITGSVPDGTTGICNSVTLSMTSGCTGSTGSTASDTECIPVIINPLLCFTKTAGCACECNKKWTAGDSVPYEIIVSHTPNSQSAAYNLIITDTPAVQNIISNVSVSFEPMCSDLAPIISITNNILNISLDTLPLGYIMKINYCVNIGVNACGQQFNTAEISWTQTPDSETPIILEPITKSINIDPPIPFVNKSALQTVVEFGEIIDYTINYANNGYSIGQNVCLTEGPFPSWFTPYTKINSCVGWVGPTGSTGCTGTTGSTGLYVYCPGNLAPGESDTVHFYLQLTGTPVGPTGLCASFDNTVTLSMNSLCGPSGSICASDTERIYLNTPVPALYIDKDIDSTQTHWKSGDLVPYIITVGQLNPIDLPAFNLTIVDTYANPNNTIVETPPIEIEFSTPGCGTLANPPYVINPGNVLTVSVIELPATCVMTIRYYVKIGPAVCGRQDNTAVLTWEDGNGVQYGPIADTASIYIICPRICVSKTPDLNVACICDVITWTITYTNPNDVDGINAYLVENYLPSWLKQINNPGWIKPPNQYSQDKYVYYIGNVPAHHSGVVDFTYKILGPVPCQCSQLTNCIDFYMTLKDTTTQLHADYCKTIKLHKKCREGTNCKQKSCKRCC